MEENGRRAGRIVARGVVVTREWAARQQRTAGERDWHGLGPECAGWTAEGGRSHVERG
jgi:hypothetical protein